MNILAWVMGQPTHLNLLIDDHIVGLFNRGVAWRRAKSAQIKSPGIILLPKQSLASSRSRDEEKGWSVLFSIFPKRLSAKP